MRNSILATVALSAVAVLAIPASGLISRDLTASDINWALMKYVGPITPGGEDHTLYRTAEHIHTQIMVLNPSFDPVDVGLVSPVRNSTTAIHKRNKIIPPNCSVGALADWETIADRIHYLQALPGSCGVGGGPSTCARISCSWNSGIYLCNDNPSPISPSCVYLGSYAGDIGYYCGYTNIEGENMSRSRSQLFDTDNYNVIVSDTSGFGQSY